MSLKLVAGLDDVATKRQLTSGWSFIVLPESELVQFETRARSLLPSAVTEFHAAELDAGNVAECQAYEDFLRLLRTTAESSAGCLIASTLNNQSWHNSLTSSASNIVTGVFATLSVTGSDIVDGAVEAAPALMTLARLLKTPSARVCSLEIDQNTNTGRFAARSVWPNGVLMPGTELLRRVADNYRKLRFPASPPIDATGLKILDSANSFLVQAADVIGNFSMNFVVRSLGPTSAGRTKKAEIFEKVFGDLLPGTPFSHLASLSGTRLELELKQGGALTFTLEQP